MLRLLLVVAFIVYGSLYPFHFDFGRTAANPLTVLLHAWPAKIDRFAWRDACMRAWHNIFPEYGLAAHKGYATPEHCRALEKFGPTPLHRLSFEPVRAQSRFPLASAGQLVLFDAAAVS